jgi:PAS domain
MAGKRGLGSPALLPAKPDVRLASRAIEEAMINLPPGLQDMPEACQVLYEHWSEIRGDALVPPRAAIDPARLRSILPYLQIVEVVRPSLIRCKLSGTALRDLFGFELTGRNMIDLTPPDQRRRRGWRYSVGALQPCGCLFGGKLRFLSGALAPYLGLVLPLRPSQKDGSMLAISAIALIRGQGWINDRSEPALNLAEYVSFLDIGAGVPDRTDPPDDWVME